ncbi:hypothetical protein HFD88_007163 [Aspergillus terreus]|nr:hypothetical protein HFD88_007163 [Aspergillus terreus]
MPLYSPPPIPVTTANQLATPQSLLETNRGFSPVANRAWVAGSNGAGHRISNTESPTTVDSDSLSLRYQYVLDHVRRAGFESFDAMVSGYYTSSFSKNSTAECAQKVSRAKRLRSVLRSLHKHSQEWTRWEARGFQEQVVEAAEDIYVAELDRVQRDSGLSMHGTMGKGQSLGELQRLYQNKVRAAVSVGHEDGAAFCVP